MSPKPHNRSRPTMRGVGAKATTPAPESAARASRDGGAVARMRKTRVQTPAERWEADKAAVLRRFRAMMAARYSDESGDCDPLASTESHAGAKSDHPATLRGSSDA